MIMKAKNKQDKIIGIVRALLIIALLTLWEVTARLGYYEAFYTSYPSEILKDLIEFYKSGDLVRHTAITLQEAFLGLFYGSVIGIGLAVLFSQFQVWGKLFNPIISAISGIPQLALAPVYVLWFGLGIFSKVFLAGLAAFFNVFFSTYNAIRNIDQRLVEASGLMGANSFNTLWHVIIPTCMPWILSGIRGGVGSCMIGAIIGEYMGSTGGFGWMITFSTSYFKIERVMSCILILLIVGIVLNRVLDWLEGRILSWRKDTKLSLDMRKKGIFN